MTALKYTFDEARDRIHQYIGTRGRPNPWWPYGPTSNDCLAYVLERLGVRGAGETNPAYFISISAFRAHFGWNEVDVDDIRPWMLVLEDWPDSGKPINRENPGHIEYVDAIDHDARTITTVSANTGPRAGFPQPNGVWKKTRPLTENFIRGVEPPYKNPAASRTHRKQVKAIAAYLNVKVPHGIPRTDAENTGVEDQDYWRLVQTWGRANHRYGPGFKIDGIPGPRTRAVRDVIWQAAKKR